MVLPDPIERGRVSVLIQKVETQICFDESRRKVFQPQRPLWAIV